MTHKHVWKPQQIGCKENPGVYSEGYTFRYHDECECGSKRLTITSCIAGNCGELVTIDGRQVRDTRNWRW